MLLLGHFKNWKLIFWVIFQGNADGRSASASLVPVSQSSTVPPAADRGSSGKYTPLGALASLTPTSGSEKGSKSLGLPSQSAPNKRPEGMASGSVRASPSAATASQQPLSCQIDKQVSPAAAVAKLPKVAALPAGTSAAGKTSKNVRHSNFQTNYNPGEEKQLICRIVWATTSSLLFSAE